VKTATIHSYRTVEGKTQHDVIVRHVWGPFTLFSRRFSNVGENPKEMVDMWFEPEVGRQHIASMEFRDEESE